MEAFAAHSLARSLADWLDGSSQRGGERDPRRQAVGSSSDPQHQRREGEVEKQDEEEKKFFSFDYDWRGVVF